MLENISVAKFGEGRNKHSSFFPSFQQIPSLRQSFPILTCNHLYCGFYSVYWCCVYYIVCLFVIGADVQCRYKWDRGCQL